MPGTQDVKIDAMEDLCAYGNLEGAGCRWKVWSEKTKPEGVDVMEYPRNPTSHQVAYMIERSTV